jgi:hypothetical protein
MSVLSYIKKFHDDDNFEDFDQNIITAYKLLNSDRPYMVIQYIYKIPDFNPTYDIYLLDNELYLIYRTKPMTQIMMKINSDGIMTKELDRNHDEKEIIKQLLFGKDNSKYNDIPTDIVICDKKYYSKSPAKYTHLYMDYDFIRIINEHRCVNIPNERPDSYLLLLWGPKVVSAYTDPKVVSAYPDNGKLYIDIYDTKLSKQFNVCWPYVDPDVAMIYDNCLYISDDLMKRIMVVNLTTEQCVSLKTINPPDSHYDCFQCCDDGIIYIICNDVVVKMDLPPWEMAVVIGQPFEEDEPDMVEIQCCDGQMKVEKNAIYGIDYFTAQMDFNAHHNPSHDLLLSVDYNTDTMTKLFEVIQHQVNHTLQDNLDLLPIADYLRADFAYQIILSNILIEGYDISCLQHIKELSDMNNDDINDIILYWIDAHRSDITDDQIEQLRNINPAFINKIFRNEVEYKFDLITVDGNLMWSEY